MSDDLVEHREGTCVSCDPPHPVRITLTGDALISHLRHRIAEQQSRLTQMEEALLEARLIVANLPHDESMFLAKIDAALSQDNHEKRP